MIIYLFLESREFARFVANFQESLQKDLWSTRKSFHPTWLTTWEECRIRHLSTMHAPWGQRSKASLFYHQPTGHQPVTNQAPPQHQSPTTTWHRSLPNSPYPSTSHKPQNQITNSPPHRHQPQTINSPITSPTTNQKLPPTNSSTSHQASLPKLLQKLQWHAAQDLLPTWTYGWHWRRRNAWLTWGHELKGNVLDVSRKQLFCWSKMEGLRWLRTRIWACSLWLSEIILGQHVLDWKCLIWKWQQNITYSSSNSSCLLLSFTNISRPFTILASLLFNHHPPQTPRLPSTKRLPLLLSSAVEETPPKRPRIQSLGKHDTHVCSCSSIIFPSIWM